MLGHFPDCPEQFFKAVRMIGVRLYKEQIFHSALPRVDPNAEIDSSGVPAYPVRGVQHREIPATIGCGKASRDRLVKIGWRTNIVVVDEDQNVWELPRRRDCKIKCV